MRKGFEWDPDKAAMNVRKHGISFETASLAFTDRHVLTEFEDHYGGEDRWHSIGKVNGELILLVVHTGWDDGETEVVRIISARRASKSERTRYEEGLRQAYN